MDFSEILLELQLREAHYCIQSHLGKGPKYAQSLSPIFLRQFPAIMDNQISVDWDCIMGIFDRAPIFPITLIDAEILDYWCAHPTVWEVAHNMQHSQCILAMVHYTLASGPKGKLELEISLCAPGAKLEYTPTHPGHPAPLTLAACCPGWDDYLDLNETVAEMSQCLIDEDGQLEGGMPKGGAIPKEKDTAQIMALPPNDDTMFVLTPVPNMDLAPVKILSNLSDAPLTPLMSPRYWPI